MITTAEQLLGHVRDALIEKKGVDPVFLDVHGISSVTDFFVIVSGASAPHLKALAEEVRRRVELGGHAKGRMEGELSSGWLVLDLGDVVVHIFLPELRERYALEDLWSDAARLFEGPQWRVRQGRTNS